MEYAAALVKLKPGSEEKLELWRSTIASRLDEAIADPEGRRGKGGVLLHNRDQRREASAVVPPSKVHQTRV